LSSFPAKPSQAPAVEEKAPVEITKTKTGRVVKSSAPQKVAKTVKAKKSATTPKKAAPKKAAAKK
jgi:histone H1/5